MRRFGQQLSIYLIFFLVGVLIMQVLNSGSSKRATSEESNDISDGHSLLRGGEESKIVEDEIEEAEVLQKKPPPKHQPPPPPPPQKQPAEQHPKVGLPADKPKPIAPRATKPPIITYDHLDFSDCQRLPADRLRKVTVPPADSVLRQEIAKLKIKTFLPKTVFRNPKMLFFAGLEGTGHHLIDGTFKDICTMVSEQIGSKCRAATNIVPNYIGNIGFKWDFRRLSENQSRHAPFLDDIKREQKMAKELMFLNSMRHHSDKFLDSAVSYPDGGHPRIDNFPDVRFLAEILSPRYDYNIILMLRDIDSLLVSTVLHRAFEPNFYNQAHIFEFMLELLVSQLSKLDPKFVIGCIKLDATPTIMRSNLKQIDFSLNTTDIKFEDLIMKSWKYKPQGACIHPDDLDPKLMYKLVVLNQKLHSFCPK